MGLLSKLFGVAAAGYAAKRTHNAVSRPGVTMKDSNYELVNMQPKGTNRWEIRYRKKGSTWTQSTMVSRRTRHTTAGGGIEIHWPD